MKRVFVVVSLLTITSMLLVGCGATPAPTAVPTAPKGQPTTAPAPTAVSGPKPGGKLIIADAESNTSLDPFVTSWHSWPHYAMYPVLFVKNLKLEYIGFLADTWEAAPDGKSLTIRLIKNATFTDGTPINAEALRWNLMRYADKATGASGGADLIGLLNDVEIIDDYTIKLVLETSFAPLYYVLSFVEIASPTAYEKWGKADFGTHPVGGAYFKFKELVTDSYLVLDRNPDFKWAPKGLYKNPGPVYFDQMVVKFLKEDQTKLAALETGEVTIAGIPSQNIATVKNNPSITLNTQMDTTIRYFGFNTEKEPWSNPALRQALGFAVNRDEIVKLAWDGQAEVLYGPLPPTIWGYYPEIKNLARPYDPAKAKAALEALGYKDVNNDGYREDPKGQPFKMVMTTSTSLETYKRMAEVLVGQFKDVGIKTEIQLVEQPALVEMTTKGTHEVFLLLYGYTDPSILTYFFDPKRIGGSNRARYNNPTLADLLVKADTDLNQTTRFETIKKIQELIVQEQPWIPLCVPMVSTGVRNELKGWLFDPEGSFLYADAYFESK